METTLGEQRVRTDFNVSGNDTVSEVKTKSAQLINLVSNGIDAPIGLDSRQTGEFLRLKNLAMTAYEEGAMWAVKAATYK